MYLATSQTLKVLLEKVFKSHGQIFVYHNIITQIHMFDKSLFSLIHIGKATSMFLQHNDIDQRLKYYNHHSHSIELKTGR